VKNAGGHHGDLVSAGQQHLANVVYGADASAYGKGYEDRLSDALDNIQHYLAVLQGGGDIQENELVSALAIVLGGLLDRVTGVYVIYVLYALDHAAVGNVKARDYSLG